MLYGHETWILLEGDLRALDVFERKVLRSIFGGVRDANGAWRRQRNDEQYELLGDPSIGILVKIGRLRWLGHIARRPVSYPAREVIERDPTDTRSTVA